ncbi:uncharacterized protein LOC110029709 [Phalaenopsis equestris]|uniref:uncharacterized protein LOC110029709 n=1 Tax=Phalaenopsis equestris TaxID=78828 RepID=UPI0009E36739|nr:uncharacterized protein LOC110029709 [Phalaenopsis equestris]
MEPSNPHTLAKRLRHIVQVVYYMLRKCISKRKLMLDLHLLLKRSKLAGKALGSLLTTFHHHHHHTTPREVEFSCSNTPYFFPSLAKRKTTRRHRADFESFDAADIAMAFKMMNVEDSDADSMAALSVLPTPSPVMVRELRITDSPFPLDENEVGNGGMIDKEADKFIKWFYEQLVKQQLVPDGDTPEYDYRRRRITGRN